jgi:hypothetical protein
LTRFERLIAGGRVVLALAAFLAVWLGPDQPRYHAVITHAVVAYLGYALVAAALVARPPAALAWLPLATQALDVAIPPVLVILTGGPTSPFLVYFLFPLLSATLRWHLRGTIWTALVSLIAFLAVGALAWLTLPVDSLDRERFLTRTAFIAVMATLLGALGAHQQALRTQLLRLARGPQSIALYAEEVARDALRHAAILEAPRVVLTWEDGEEPWLNFASSAGTEVTVGREPPTTWAP